MKTTTLNKRQIDLYKYLAENGKKSVEEICKYFPQYYMLNNNPKSHDKNFLIRNDANIINFSPLVDRIIITDGKYNFWLAENEKELQDYADKHLRKGLIQLNKYWNIVKKSNKDIQVYYDENSETFRTKEVYKNGN